MSETNVRRRGFGEDGIYLDAARNRYMGAISLGYGPDGKRIRRKVSGKTKQEVRAKLQALHQELNSGVRSSSTYTVREAVDDWLREGLDGTSERTRTLYEGLLGPVLDAIGARPLRVLSAGDVRMALSKLATRYSTRSLQITRNSLERAIRHAESNDLVGRNVAALVKAPQGRSGRPSKSFTLDQAKALLAGSVGTRLHAYVVLSLLVGIRTEEARALRWDHVVTWVDDPAGWQPVTNTGFDPTRSDEGRFAIYVWRSEREGGDTKTEKSRRTLALPRRCVEALRQQQDQQGIAATADITLSNERRRRERAQCRRSVLEQSPRHDPLADAQNGRIWVATTQPFYNHATINSRRGSAPLTTAGAAMGAAAVRGGSGAVRRWWPAVMVRAWGACPRPPGPAAFMVSRPC